MILLFLLSLSLSFSPTFFLPPHSPVSFLFGVPLPLDVPGIDLAVKAEHGNRHTAHMHSKNIDNLTAFARAVETTIFVKNAPSYAGIGFGGEGHTTFTIAGPTGEGITSARSFPRKRRCVMVDSFRII